MCSIAEPTCVCVCVCVCVCGEEIQRMSEIERKREWGVGYMNSLFIRLHLPW